MKNNRKCVATGKIFPKNELIRIVKMKDGNFKVDSNEKGRGVYVSKNIELFENIVRRKLINRSLRREVPSWVYDELKKKLEEE